METSNRLFLTNLDLEKCPTTFELDLAVVICT